MTSGRFDRTPRSTQSTRASQAALQPVDHDECIAPARWAACPGRWPRIALRPAISARPSSGSPATTCRSAEPGSQDSRPARSGPMARMSFRAARLPAALAASRQRFSTEDRSPVAAVIGVSSWPAACRNISGIWMARAAPAETNAGAGRVQPVPADHLGVCRSLWCQAVTLVTGVPAQFHVPRERVLPRRGAVTLVIAAITPGALTAGQARRPRGVVSRPGRERPQAAGDHAPPGGPVTAIGREGASAL